MENVKVRTAKGDDLDRVYKLWHSMIEFHTHIDNNFKTGDDTYSFFKSYFIYSLNSSNIRYTISSHDDECIGFARCRVVMQPELYSESMVGKINELYIKQEFRNKGIAKILIEDAIRWLSNKGIATFEVEVAAKNIEGVNFWRNSGFTDFKYLMRKRP